MNQLPISTQLLVNSNGEVNTNLALSVVLVACLNTGNKGTGWLCSDRHIVTNEHVVRNASLNQMIVVFSDGRQVQPIAKSEDIDVDLAVLTLQNSAQEIPLRIKIDISDVGSKVCAWGHPLGYNGPAPILSVGYVAGFNGFRRTPTSPTYQRLVINAALNPGNSGGPILVWGENAVCGVAVTKHAPITQALQSRIDALSNNRSGLQFTGQDARGNQIHFSESQLVADVLKYFQSMTQVVIGEAVSPQDIANFLNANSIPWIQA
jgi:hypothetical protein